MIIFSRFKALSNLLEEGLSFESILQELVALDCHYADVRDAVSDFQRAAPGGNAGKLFGVFGHGGR